MLCCAVLCCFVLCCFCAVLFRAVLFCAVLFCAVLFCAVLCCCAAVLCCGVHVVQVSELESKTDSVDTSTDLESGSGEEFKNALASIRTQDQDERPRPI